MGAQSTNSTFSPVVPQLVSFSGSAVNEQGKALSGIVGITFSIYSTQQGSSPLWLETQNVQTDARGNYTVQLGATTSQGLPLSLFSSGEARWLSVRVNGGEEQPRVLLLSVPYALKAADAQTLGGLPASAFALAAPSGGGSAGTNGSAPNASSPASPNVGGSGTEDYIPLWTDNSGDLGNSILYQSGSGNSARIGINLKNPLFTLDVNGSDLVRGLFEMATTNYATKTTGYNSNPLNFESSAFSSSTGKYTLNHFQWQAEPTANNTTTPGATLNLLYGTDPAAPTETGLSISSTGIFTFAPGQTFPGGNGTVTSVGLSAPSSDFTVSGSPVTTSGTLGLNWIVAPTNADNANAIVKRDPNGAFSSGEITATASDTNPAVTANSTNPSLGFGLSAYGSGAGVYANGGTGVLAGGTTGVGATGTTTGVQASGGITGVIGYGSLYGLLGTAAGTNTAYGVYGSATTSNIGVGVYGSGTQTGVYGNSYFGTPVYGLLGGSSSGITGTATAVWGDTSNSNSGSTAGVLGTISEGFLVAGVQGVVGSPSQTGAAFLGRPAGVWGDSGCCTGVFGTADNGIAISAFNNSTDFSALNAQNNGNGPALWAGGLYGDCTVSYNGDLQCTGSKSAVVHVSGDRQVALYAVESPENWFEDFGSGQLVNGAATVTLDPTFAETVNLTLDYHVFLTPNGDCKGLYVEQKDADSFEVRELGRGTSNVAFDYRIVAKRLGYESKRLVDLHEQLERIRSHSLSSKLSAAKTESRKEK